MIRSKIKSIKKVNTQSSRYDLEVKNTNNFFANDVLVHNCRVITVIHDIRGEKIEMFSRNGKQFLNFDHIIDEIRAVLHQTPAPYPLVLDGEVMSASFQDLMKQVHRKDNVAAGDANLFLFDALPLDKFLEGGWEKPQSFRSEIVKAWVTQHQSLMPHIRYLEWENVDLDTPEGQEAYSRINAAALASKYEGIMIKNPEAPYECKRSHNWLKAKPFIEVTLSIVGVEEGTGRNKGRLGALVCEGVDDGRTISVNVGSGFSDDQRLAFWTYRDEILYQMIEVRADAISQNQDGTYSLRFPRFKVFRGFKPGEKL